jgi:hypothetical protein
MVRSSKAWRPLRIWWASPLALMLCICISGNGVRAEERLVLAMPDVAGSPAPFQAEGLAEEPAADDPKVRYLIEELITQRFEGARLSIELAAARIEAAQIKDISHEQANLLTSLIAALGTRDRENATLRAQTADLQQRLGAAQTELEHERVENGRLAAELGAVQEGANWVQMMALGNLPAWGAARASALHASNGSVALERAKQPAEILSAIWVDSLPAIPSRRKPPLGETE